MQLLRLKHLALLGLCSAGICCVKLPLNAWSTPVAISTAPGMTNPTPSYLAIDKNSNSVVGWLEGEIGVGNQTFTASLPAGAPSWNSPIPLYSNTDPNYASFPLLFADNNGDSQAVMAIFHKNGSVVDQMTALSTSQPVLGNSWPSPVAADPIAGFPNGGGSVGSDAAGNLLSIIAFTADSNTYAPPFNIYFLALPHAGSWTTPLNLGVDTGSTQPAIFATASEGGGVIGWKISDNLSFKTSRYTFDGNQIDPIGDIPLPTGTVDVGLAKATMSTNGNVTAVLGIKIASSQNYLLYYSFLPAGSSTWSFPKLLSNPNNTIGYPFTSIDSDVNSHAVIVWGELNSSTEAIIRGANIPFGGDATNVTNLTNYTPISLDNGIFTGVFVDVDTFGNAAAIWQLYVNGTTPTVQVAALPVDGSWTNAQTLSTTGNMPRIALSDQGTGVATWIDSATGLITGSSDNHLFPLAAPGRFVGMVFNNNNQYTLKMYWDASEAPNVVNYEVFHDGELIGTIPGAGPYKFSQLLDCRFTQGAYTLVAVASNGNKSQPVTLTLIE